MTERSEGTIRQVGCDPLAGRILGRTSRSGGAAVTERSEGTISERSEVRP